MRRISCPPASLWRITAAAFLFLACTPRVESNEVLVNQSRPLGDSIVLERTACYGVCPAYRLRLSNSGEIRFESRNSGDPDRFALDTVPAGLLVRLISHANAIGFFELPPKISDDVRLCGPAATDHSTVVVTIFSRRGAKSVEDYLGCHGSEPRLARLRSFEAEVDSALRSSRWVRPAL